MRLTAFLLLAGLSLPVVAQAQLSSPSSAVYFEPSQTLIREDIQVPAGRVSAYNFTLEPGTTLSADFRVSGGANNQIKVWLVDAVNYQLLLAGRQFNYFTGTSGSVRNTAKYAFQVPQANIYYLVLDNTGAWLLPRNVQLYVYARLPQPTPQQIEAQRQMNSMYDGLKSFFIFDDFHISIQHCGLENAFSDPNITICMELVESLHDQNLDQAVAFVLFHELGHTLLRSWGQPGWDNEDMADEFATALLVIAKQQQTALSAAQWWASQTSEQQALAKLWLDDRHTVSPQRARNIVHWLNQPDEFVRRWLRVLTPNMQTEALKKLLDDTDPRIDKTLVRGELAKRQYATQR
jgi:Putative metallopeptidase